LTGNICPKPNSVSKHSEPARDLSFKASSECFSIISLKKDQTGFACQPLIMLAQFESGNTANSYLHLG
jgi:hypothetical protein